VTSRQTVEARALPPILRLRNAVRDYAWGSVTAIPELLGIEPTGAPAAELWMGAHPDEPSRWADDPAEPGLDALIDAWPQEILGAGSVSRFGPRLPFLLKVLAAEKCLSMQVHPNAEQARAGYLDEEQRGIPRTAAQRNYSDAFAKPELLYALTEVDALCGFRPVAGTVQLFDALIGLGVSRLSPYRDLLAAEEGIRATFTTMLTLPEAARLSLIDSVIAGCRSLVAADAEQQWSDAAGASVLAAEDFPGDIGAVLALLLNHVRLRPGQAIFLGAGNVHAYLRGMGVEILANSDNVLRCGLTPKHVDVPELLRIADFSPLAEPLWEPRVSDEPRVVFDVPVPDFRLTVVQPSGAEIEVAGHGPMIVLNTAGSLTVQAAGAAVQLERGESAFVRAGASEVRVLGSGQAFVASEGL
jgi:mannose-6-phosphate isomerase